ncbi:unnamed protein product [Miscanthus lutarioriparius]|uniref:HAT C-terminal dimerisation domain-containing protein n=1 Tax=Miscanthus lutarioriparius TaxID=422564 RepID=A0A811RTX4_9POAL|nr:unnamed protein product [Miscanthus lutarioriparius]
MSSKRTLRNYFSSSSGSGPSTNESTTQPKKPRARRTPEFLGCTELGKVAEIMVKTKMHESYKLVYRLIELTLILPVATTSVERIFSAMSIIKTYLRSKMGDDWLNDLMICYNEKEKFRKIDNEKIKKRFQDMKKRHCYFG